jgi:hypothetical protein
MLPAGCHGLRPAVALATSLDTHRFPVPLATQMEHSDCGKHLDLHSEMHGSSISESISERNRTEGLEMDSSGSYIF